MSEVIDMCRKIRDKKLTFVLNPDDAWEKFDNEFKSIVNCEWEEVKFLDNSSLELHGDMRKLPDDIGGVYTFVLKSDIIPDTHACILYIGRAKHTASHNLKVRCRKYLNDVRPNILTMVDSWGKNLYIRYFPINDNDLIEKLEIELLRAFLPPCNDEFPDKITRMAIKAAFM